MTVEQKYPTASLRRRLAAQTYDFFLLFALWAVTGSILMMVFGDAKKVVIELTDAVKNY